MKPTTYINWDGLKDIPFFYCDTKEDEENKDFDIYYQGRLVLHDYNHCGHYLYTAAVLFSRIKNKTADWVRTCETFGFCVIVCVRTTITA